MTNTEIEMNATLTETQVVAAHKLANTHYHEWRKLDLELVPRPITAAGIYKAAQARGLDPMGIMFPSVMIADDGRPYVVHSTGTGRTAWEIAPDGSVSVEISRPAGLLMTATFVYDPAQLRWACTEFWQEDAEVLPTWRRHAHALARVLKALSAPHPIRIDVDEDAVGNFVHECRERDGVPENKLTKGHVLEYVTEAARAGLLPERHVEEAARYLADLMYAS